MHLKRWLMTHVVDRFLRSTRTVFTDIYRTRHWGDSESASGSGSSLRGTTDLRTNLPPLLARHHVKRFLDAPCGDLNWMKEVPLPVEHYIGADIVPELVDHLRRTYAGPHREFIVADICTDPLPKVDVIMCRDCLIHLPFRKVKAALANFRRSGSTYLLANHDYFVRTNEDIPTGRYRPLNLTVAPFSIGDPIEVIADGELHPTHAALAGSRARLMGLWRLQLPE
jgi:SAM-dependent methyltransferase